MAGHQRRADTPAGGGRADGRTPRRAADRGALYYILRMGIHAYAMGEGRIQREPQRGGREDASTFMHPARSHITRRASHLSKVY
jgi:hypothetical protein